MFKHNVERCCRKLKAKLSWNLHYFEPNTRIHGHFCVTADPESYSTNQQIPKGGPLQLILVYHYIIVSNSQAIEEELGGFGTAVDEVGTVLGEWRRCLGAWSEHSGKFSVGILAQCSSAGREDGPTNIQPDDISSVVILADIYIL